MNKYLTVELKQGQTFSEDSFIFEDMFFLPKLFPLQLYHLKLLNEWNIDSVYSNGIVSFDTLKKGEFHHEETDKSSQQETPAITENENNKTLPLLDNSVTGFIENYKRWIKEIISFFNSISSKKEIDKEKVKKIVDEICESTKLNKNNALLLFGKKFENISYYYTQAIENVILCYILGEGLNLSSVTLFNLTIASLFHDIGMTKIPKEILNKEEKLTEEEMSTIRNHTVNGYKMLLEVKYSPIIASGALQHHERLDGKGYPNALTQNKITDVAKIISVSDVYCAAISSKPYKTSPMHAKQIIQELLKGGGISFSSVVLKELVKNISFYPIGSFVLLSNDIPARVVGTSGAPMKPIVKIVNKEDNEKIIDQRNNETIYIKNLYKKTADQIS